MEVTGPLQSPTVPKASSSTLSPASLGWLQNINKMLRSFLLRPIVSSCITHDALQPTRDTIHSLRREDWRHVTCDKTQTLLELR